VLVAGHVLEVDDEVFAREFEQMIDEGNEEVFSRLGAEDTFEDEVGLGVGENGVHGGGLRHVMRSCKHWGTVARVTQNLLYERCFLGQCARCEYP
jgi:hypothetical protein